MKSFLTNFLFLGIACAGLIAALPLTRAADTNDPTITADKAVEAALTKGDKGAASKWLDPDFSWIDSEGIMWAKDDAFRAELKPLIAEGGDVKVTEHKYGKSVVWIQWQEGNKYSAKFWVKRPSGWKLLHMTEIASIPRRDFQTVEPTYDIPCDNPCKAVPYKPISAGEKAALDEWQEQESSQANWEKHVADNMDQRAVSTYGGASPSKADRIAGMNKRQSGKSQRPQSGSGTGTVDPHLGFRRRRRNGVGPADLWRQGVLVKPRSGAKRVWSLANDGELPQLHSGFAGHDGHAQSA